MDGKHSDARLPCKLCGRSFAPDALARHTNICKKTTANSSKRKPFDSSKQRVVEGELSLKQIKQAQKKEVKPPKSHWREQHQDFINAVRSARGVQHAINSGGTLPPPPPPSINADYVQCPYCTRRFNQKAAERHISFCKDQQSRLPRDKPISNAAKQSAHISYPTFKPKIKSNPVSTPANISTTHSPAARGGARPTPAKTQVKAPIASTRTPQGGSTSSSSKKPDGGPATRTPASVPARGQAAGRRY